MASWMQAGFQAGQKATVNGRIGLTISASLARQRDPGFVKLMAGLAMLID